MRFSIKSTVRTGSTLLLAAGLATTSVAPAQAFFWLLDPKVAAYHDHIVYCKLLAFKDLQQHAKECGPFKKPGPRFIDTPDDSAPPPRKVNTPKVTSPVVNPPKGCDGKCGPR